MKKKVIVGMSGGVDSSVSAYLLKQQGYEVVGLFMKNWEEKDEAGRCISSKEFDDVVRVCDQLQIPYYTVNFTEAYSERVFSLFLEGLKKGETPNPDILCNQEIKFQLFFEKALQMGADFLATGHYCRTNAKELLKGKDPHKDQSYFLYAMNPDTLPRVLFPIGDLEKSEVRRIAKKAGLATAEKKDSVGICFIGKRNFKQFVSQYLAFQPGSLMTLEGKVVGKHDGAAYYTLGQRKGLGIGGEGEAWFVVKKDVEQNIIYVAQGKDHPALYSHSLEAHTVHWITSPPRQCKAKIRYRQVEEECSLEQKGDRLFVTFSSPQRAVTPGQSIVFYQDDVCLGGAIISSAACK